MDVVVFDNFLDEITNNKLTEYFSTIEWKYGNVALTSMTRDIIPHWWKPFHIENYKEGTPINDVKFENEYIRALYEKIKPLLSPTSKLLRCYANGYTCGNDANIHYDDLRLNTTTFIFYPMDYWQVDWGGETIFWDKENREIVKSVIPKTNRMIQFSSCLWHGARPVSRYCKKLRITLMFKFIDV